MLPPGKTESPWGVRARELRYANPWIRVEHHEVLTPAGTEGIYGVVRFGNVAVGVVTLDEEGYTTLVGQWRYPLAAYSWEIPEGGAPHGEDPLEAAKRELAEETGLRAARWTLICPRLHLSNSVTDERGVVYLAEGLSVGQAAPEETEDLAIARVPLAEAVAMALDGRISDMLAVVGLLAADRHVAGRGDAES